MIDEATNTMMTENGPINIGTDDSQKPGIAKTLPPKKARKTKKPTKVSQILKLSEKGLTPLEISRSLGVKLHYVYTARAQMKARGVGRWHQIESMKRQEVLDLLKREHTQTNNKAIKKAGRTAADATVDATFVSPMMPYIHPYTPQQKITFLELKKRPSFFSRIKAAYAAFKGE